MMEKTWEGITINLQEKVKSLPSTPGVYLMKDFRGEIIYVGKAKNLKKRVQTYFQRSQNHSPKVEKLVKAIKDFDVIHTDTEFEAFMKECQLIQEMKPHYNSKMKNPLAYSYIEIQTHQEYYHIKTTSHPNEAKNSLYFGPYASKGTVERALDGIKKYFKIDCANPSRKNSACLNHSLGLCIGMCLGGPAIQTYNDIIHSIVSLLDGTNKSVVKEIEEKMVQSSEQFDFKTAAMYRDLLGQINYLLNRKKVIDFTEANQNIAVMEPLFDGEIKLFLIKGNKILFSDILLRDEHLVPKVMNHIFSYFATYERTSSLPITQFEIDEAQIIYSYLKRNDCSYIIIPETFRNREEIKDALVSLINQREMPSNV